MTTELIILAIVIFTALAFDFTNGFHDTANATAASISTGALKPKQAVSLATILNLVGALISVEVALTVTNSVITAQEKSGAPKAEFLVNGGTALITILLAGLVGSILWNIFTWLLGLPSSSSHALLGGMVGAAVAGLGWTGVKWVGEGAKLDGVVGKILLPALLSPIIAMAVAALGTRLVYWATAKVDEKYAHSRFRWGQIGSASLVSLAHGTNDAQKTMGLITLALIAAGEWTDTTSVPLWVKLACATAIALGTYLGGWRIIRTMGKGLVDITRPQGLAADSSSAVVILASSQLGFALSTTHVASGSILGSGVGRKGAEVRWSVAGRMAIAWALTFPAAGAVGALMWAIAHAIGGLAGALVVVAILVAASGYMWLRSRRRVVDASNVNDAWDPGKPAVESPASATAPVIHSTIS